MNVDSLNVSDNVKQLLKAMDAEGTTLDRGEFLTVCRQLDRRDVVTISGFHVRVCDAKMPISNITCPLAGKIGSEGSSVPGGNGAVDDENVVDMLHVSWRLWIFWRESSRKQWPLP